MVFAASEASAAAPSSAARPLIVDGALGPARPVPDDAAAIAIARTALATHLPWTASVTLSVDRVDLRDDGSRLVRFAQTIDGIVVEDRGARVLVDATGVPRVAAARVDDRAPTARSAVIDEKAAATIAARGRRIAFDATRARLRWIATGREPRLAWIVPGALPWEVPMRPIAAIDAVTGDRIYARDLVKRAKLLKAFATNPVEGPLTMFTLTTLPDGAKTLTTTAFDAFSCVDDHGTRSVDLGSPVTMHVCDLKHAAVADAAGDFLYPRPASDSAVDDPFSETSAAWHVNRALTSYLGMGLPAFRKASQPITVVANVRMPPSWEEGPIDKLSCTSCALEPVENAFFAPVPGSYGDLLFGLKGDGLFLGQGAKLDYGYDGDVVYHELGHAVVESTAKLSGALHFDEWGASMAPGAMNEGMADFLSSTISGDPALGEYVGGGVALRNLDNADTCLEKLSNEVHEDSTPFSGALWTVRASLDDAKKKLFDRGVMLGLQLAPSGDLSEAQLLQVIEKGLDTEAGPMIGLQLADEAKTRGLDTCARVRELATGGGKSSFEYGFFSYGVPYADKGAAADDLIPGGTQFHLTLPPGSTKVTVSFDGRTLPPDPAWLSDTPWNPILLVRFDQPMKWTNDPAGWTGAFDVRRDVSSDGHVAEDFTVPAGAKDVYVMVAATSDGLGLYDNVDVVASTSPLPPDAGPVDSGVDAGHDGGALHDAGADGAFKPADDLPPLEVVNGRACGCRTAGEGTTRAGFPLSLVALAALLARRRRS